MEIQYERWARLERIAHLTGVILAYGVFKDEKMVLELKKLLRENHTFWENAKEYEDYLEDADND